MKTIFALALTFASSLAFSCADLSGQYQCEDKYSYSYYRNFEIQQSEYKVSITENGRPRFKKSLEINGPVEYSGGVRFKARCEGNTLKVTGSVDRLSETETFSKSGKNLIVTLKEETGTKRLKCLRQ